jgi:hypothetical protein
VEIQQNILAATAPQDFFALSRASCSWYKASQSLTLLKTQFLKLRPQSALAALLDDAPSPKCALQTVRKHVQRSVDIADALTRGPHRTHKLAADGLRLRQVALSRQGDKLGIAYENVVRYFKTLAPMRGCTTLSLNAVVVGAQFSGDGSELMLTTEGGAFVRYAADSAGLRPPVSVNLNARALWAYAADDGQTLLTHHTDSHVAWLSDLRKDPITTFPLTTEQEITSAALSRDGAWAVTVDYAKTIKLWDLKADTLASKRLVLSPTTSLAARLYFVPPVIRATAISPDNRWVAAGMADGRIAVWDLCKPNAMHRTIDGAKSAALKMVFSQDGRFLATATCSTTAHIFDLAQQPATSIALDGPSGRLMSIAFSDDNRFVVTASADHAVFVYDFAKDAGSSSGAR